MRQVFFITNIIGCDRLHNKKNIILVCYGCGIPKNSLIHLFRKLSLGNDLGR